MKFLDDEHDKISAALVKFHSVVTPIPKASENPQFKSKYADLATIMKHIQPALIASELAVTQTVEFDDGMQPMQVETLILHSSGQGFVSFVPYIMPDRGSGPQAHGSAQTYARRYGVTSALGIAAGDDDDDGNTAQGSTTAAAKPPQQLQTKTTKPSEVRKMTSRIESQCGICKEKIEKMVQIAFKRDEQGTGHAAHWECYQVQEGVPTSDEESLHSNAPDMPDNEVAADEVAKANPKPAGNTAADDSDLPF